MSTLSPGVHRLLVAVAGALALLAAGCDARSEPAADKGAGRSAAPAPSPAAKPTADAAAGGSATPVSRPTTDRAGWPAVVRVGLVPVEGGADTRERYTILQERLNSLLGVPVELVSASSYQGIITAMANDQLEFAGFGPKSYVEAASRAEAEALLVELNIEGERGYRCIFIVPAASPITSIAEARGKRFAFTDPNSTSGWLIPAMVLLDLTGEPAERYFGQIAFSGAHSTSMLQVASGDIDIAATNDLDLNKAVTKGTLRGDAVRVIHRTDMIPGAPFAARRDLPGSLKQAFVAAMLEMSKDAAVREALQNGGYEPVTDGAYDVIRASQKFMADQEAAKKAGG